MLIFDHWTRVPSEVWRWPNFSPDEIACRGTAKVGIDPEAMDKLQALRIRLGAPLMLNSAYRSPEHNAAVGGAKASQHLKARAFDVSMANHDPAEFEHAARAVGFTGFGFYRRNNFIHVDIGPAREWGERWKSPRPASNLPPARFSPPPPHRPETIAEDKGLRGAALGAGGGVALLTALGNMIGNLTPAAQAIAVAGALALAAGIAYVIRDRLREWR